MGVGGSPVFDAQVPPGHHGGSLVPGSTVGHGTAHPSRRASCRQCVVVAAVVCTNRSSPPSVDPPEVVVGEVRESGRSALAQPASTLSPMQTKRKERRRLTTYRLHDRAPSDERIAAVRCESFGRGSLRVALRGGAADREKVGLPAATRLDRHEPIR